MRITRIEMHEVGPFEHATFDFPPPDQSAGELVLFEGPNGAGKTTLMQALAVIALALPQRAHAHYRPDTGWSMPGPLATDYQGRFRSKDSAIRITVQHGRESVEFMAGGGRNAEISAPAIDGELTTWLASAYSTESLPQVRWAAFLFDAVRPTPSVATTGPQQLPRPDVSTILPYDNPSMPVPLGQVLANFDYERVRAGYYAREKARSAEERARMEATEQRYDRAIHRMEHALSAVLDRRVEFKFQPGDPAPRILFDGEAVALGLLGEGLRSTLAWLATLLVRLELTPWANTDITPLEHEFWLLLDEIDVYLHPQMQRRLFPVLRGLFPAARIYATTHSPFAVAGAAQGHVFSISPDAGTRRVHGVIPVRALTPGQSLELVVEEIFDTPSLFIDQDTQDRLRAHDQDVQRLRGGGTVDWEAFLANRRELMSR